MDKICLKGLRFEAIHGVYEEEKHVKQPFCVDIELSVDTRAAAKADDLSLSVDYSLLYGRVAGIMNGESCNLLETLAERIAQAALADTRVDSVRVAVEKCRATWEKAEFTSSVVIERGRA